MNLIQGKTYKLTLGHSFCHVNKMKAICYDYTSFNLINKNFIFLGTEDIRNGKLYKIFCEENIMYFFIFNNNVNLFKFEDL